MIIVLEILQAAWIVDDSDTDDGDSDEDGDEGMVLDDVQKHKDDFELDDDQGSLFLRESDEETETDSMMMVSIW